MQLNYSIQEVKEILDAARDGESLEEVEARMAANWIERCRERGENPSEIIREVLGIFRTDRD